MRKASLDTDVVERVKLKPIEDVAALIGIKQKFLKKYGHYIAKISLNLKTPKKKKAKYIIVSSITPTPQGEGKTVTTIGLSMALWRLKKKSIATIRQPALGPVLGMKGAGTGGGFCQALPVDEINLHFTGDAHAVTLTHNLAACFLDNSIFTGNPLGIDPNTVTWKRVTDIYERFLRNINIGLGGKADGISRKTGFDLTPSSEIMGILTLTEGIKELITRLSRVIIGYTSKGRPVTAEDIKCHNIMAAILRDALMPNIVQSTENTPVLVHTTSFGNIGLGTSSVIADKIGLALCDYVITETGFGSELGAEKCFDIKCRTSRLTPEAVVLVVTIRALKFQSGDYDLVNDFYLPKEIYREDVSAVQRGLANLQKHIEGLESFGIPIVVCINRFQEDTEKEITAVKNAVEKFGVHSVVVSELYHKGGEGGIELAERVIDACKSKSSFRFLYPVDLSIKEKISRIAKTMYGTKEIIYTEDINNKINAIKKIKLDSLPVCINKTHLSISNNPKKKGRPHGFRVHIVDIQLFAGAGYINVLCDKLDTMPVFPRHPRAEKISLTDDGRIEGIL